MNSSGVICPVLRNVDVWLTGAQVSRRESILLRIKACIVLCDAACAAEDGVVSTLCWGCLALRRLDSRSGQRLGEVIEQSSLLDTGEPVYLQVKENVSVSG